MPLVTPGNAFRQLYPGIEDHQWQLRDDGAGAYVFWMDPAIEPEPANYPTFVQLEAAELSYRGPSILEGGEREPDVDDIDFDRVSAQLFFELRVREHVDAFAGTAGYRRVDINPADGYLRSRDDANLVAKYTSGSRRYQYNAQLIADWVSECWEYYEDQRNLWLADGRRTFTWAVLEAELPATPTLV